MASLLLEVLCSSGSASEVGCDFCLVEEHLYLADFRFVTCSACKFVCSVVVSSYDFVFRRLTAGFVVADAESNHVHSHVGRRLVGVGTVDAFEQSVEYGEYLDVAVVVYRNLVVCLQMERVNHVHVVEVGSCCLVGDVYRVFQWQVPDGECLKLGIAGSHTALVLVVELAKTHCHLAAARARCCHDDERTLGLYIVVFAESLVRGYELHVVRVALDEVVAVGLYAVALQTLTESDGCRLPVIVGYDNGAYKETTILEFAAQTQHVLVVGDAEVGAFLVLLNVGGTDDNHDFYAVAYLLEHAQLAVRHKSWQHTACVMVVEEFASKFEVEFSVKL